MKPLVSLSKEDERLAQLRDLMQGHKGKSSAVSSRDLADKLGIKERDTFSITRSLIERKLQIEGRKNLVYQNYVDEHGPLDDDDE